MSAVPPPIPIDSAAPHLPSAGQRAANPDTLPQRRHHRDMLWLAIAVIVLSLLLKVEGDRVAFFFLPRLALPQVCSSRRFLGISCPGCGLTRSFVYLAHGRWYSAWHVHRLGWLLAALTVLQIPYRLICLRWGSILTAKDERLVIYLIIAVLTGNWIIELMTMGLRH